MNKNTIVSAVILLAVAGITAYALFRVDDAKPLRSLPFYGPSEVNGNRDTTFHTIKDFSFTDQSGSTITQKDIENKMVVVDYFFTTCHSICPIMSTQMERVAAAYKGNGEVVILSHTVDPETDSVPVMAEYAQKHNADKNQWHFLTGDKKKLYETARLSYFLDAEEGDGGPDDFIHTQNFVLIDKQKHIRGYYDGTNPQEVDKLITDINVLLKEDAYNKGLKKGI
jgi:protein SCO1/2